MNATPASVVDSILPPRCVPCLTGSDDTDTDTGHHGARPSWKQALYAHCKTVRHFSVQFISASPRVHHDGAQRDTTTVARGTMLVRTSVTRLVRKHFSFSSGRRACCEDVRAPAWDDILVVVAGHASISERVDVKGSLEERERGGLDTDIVARGGSSTREVGDEDIVLRHGARTSGRLILIPPQLNRTTLLPNSGC